MRNILFVPIHESLIIFRVLSRLFCLLDGLSLILVSFLYSIQKLSCVCGARVLILHLCASVVKCLHSSTLAANSASFAARFWSATNLALVTRTLFLSVLASVTVCLIFYKKHKKILEFDMIWDWSKDKDTTYSASLAVFLHSSFKCSKLLVASLLKSATLLCNATTCLGGCSHHRLQWLLMVEHY